MRKHGEHLQNRPAVIHKDLKAQESQEQTEGGDKKNEAKTIKERRAES